jgi:hypothetical protein
MEQGILITEQGIFLRIREFSSRNRETYISSGAERCPAFFGVVEVLRRDRRG